MDYTVHGILQARTLEWVAFPFSRGSSQPRDQTQVSCIAGRFFTSWPTREAQEYWSGSLSPPQLNLPIQELNQGLLHCRRILYRLSYQGLLPNHERRVKEAKYQWDYILSLIITKQCNKAKNSRKRWRRQWQPTPVLLPGKSHGRNLMGCSPWGREESEMTEQLHFHFSLSCIMATHSSVLAWRIPGMGEPGGLPSMGSHRVRHNWSDLAAATKKYDLNPTSSQEQQLDFWIISMNLLNTHAHIYTYTCIF